MANVESCGRKAQPPSAVDVLLPEDAHAPASVATTSKAAGTIDLNDIGWEREVGSFAGVGCAV